MAVYTAPALLKDLPISIHGIMNACIENTLIFSMSMCSWNRNLPLALLDYLSCHYTKQDAFRTIHLILSFTHLCLVCKDRSLADWELLVPWREETQAELQTLVRRWEQWYIPLLFWEASLLSSTDVLFAIDIQQDVQC